jgi:hypothetical protein
MLSHDEFFKPNSQFIFCFLNYNESTLELEQSWKKRRVIKQLITFPVPRVIQLKTGLYNWFLNQQPNTSLPGQLPSDACSFDRGPIQGLIGISLNHSLGAGMRPKSSTTCCSPINRTGTDRPSLFNIVTPNICSHKKMPSE